MSGEPEDSSADAADTDDHLRQAADLIGSDTVWSGQLLYTAATVGLFDLLADTRKSGDEIASELDLHPDTTYRFLRALSHFGVLEETADTSFSLTAVGELFRSDHPDSVRSGLLLSRSPEWLLPMLHLEDVIAEGGPSGFEREFGRGLFDYLEANPEFGTIFDDHMTARSIEEAEAVLSALDGYDFSRFTTVCDIAGGHGRLLCRVLEEHPHMEGIILERPSVIDQDDRLWAAKLDVANRCQYIAGDMFESVPTAEVYFMKSILHDWQDGDCARILSNIKSAVTDDGRLFIVEAVVPGPDESHFAKRLDMTMMIHAGGRERTLSEYESLLAETGWAFVERRDLEESPLSVLEAKPE